MTTVQQLREALRENGLPTSGNKQELLKRLGTIGKPSASNGSTSEGYGSATTPTPSYSSWKLAQIRSELRRRQLPVSGNKDSLVDRLKQHDVTLSATKIEPSAHNFSPKIKPPTPHADPAIHNYPQAELESQQEIECSRLTIWRQPLRTLWYLSKGISFYAVQLLNYGKHHRLTILMMALALLSAAVVHFIESPYQSSFHRAEEQLLWYGYWVILGIASSIGLGTGLHTFVLFLGPHIARVAVTAQECGTVDFSIHGEGAFVCDEKDYFVGASLVAIYSKVILESFAWGAGTAIGELPPYFVARAAALAGREEEEIDHIEAIKRKSADQRSVWENVQVFMFSMMQRLGFWGILLSASIPNPLFDLAGITCGHFLVPFTTFFGATFVGKALIKASIQTWFIIILFSKEILEYLLKILATHSNYWHSVVEEMLFHQKEKFEKGHGSHSHHHENMFSIGVLWNGVIVVMIAYFLLSIIHSIAAAQLRKDLQSLKK